MDAHQITLLARKTSLACIGASGSEVEAVIEQTIRTAVNKILSEAAQRINILYANPPEAYAKFDLRQGWDYALDLAEQQVNALKLP